MRLTVGKAGYSQLLEFYGQGNSLKVAKNDAASRALKTNLVVDLRKLCTQVAPNTTYEYVDKSSDQTKIGKLAQELSQIAFHSTKEDPIYNAWLKAKQLGIPYSIDFVNVKKGIKNVKIQVRATMGNKQFSGKFE